ncbi:MAG: hypothetical protein A07HB70_01979 [uncultured archaeon A07HB70]|nr:MAG: hypothetical protein A07HB70_01979 [uncultured archaeon A07HB70]
MSRTLPCVLPLSRHVTCRRRDHAVQRWAPRRTDGGRRRCRLSTPARCSRRGVLVRNFTPGLAVRPRSRGDAARRQPSNRGDDPTDVNVVSHNTDAGTARPPASDGITTVTFELTVRRITSNRAADTVVWTGQRRSGVFRVLTTTPTAESTPRRRRRGVGGSPRGGARSGSPARQAPAGRPPSRRRRGATGRGRDRAAAR